MDRITRPISLHRNLHWLLWLALLLPLAQSMASWHRYSHRAQTEQRQDEGKQVGHAACELCLSTAALGGAALSGAPLPLVLLAVRHALPLPVLASLWLARPTLAYQSRAPPVSR